MEVENGRERPSFFSLYGDPFLSNLQSPIHSEHGHELHAHASSHFLPAASAGRSAGVGVRLDVVVRAIPDDPILKYPRAMISKYTTYCGNLAKFSII